MMVTAPQVRAIDQQPANARRAQLGKGDLLAARFGHETMMERGELAGNRDVPAAVPITPIPGERGNQLAILEAFRLADDRKGRTEIGSCLEVSNWGRRHSLTSTKRATRASDQ